MRERFIQQGGPRWQQNYTLAIFLIISPRTRLHDHFAQHGTVISARIISDKFTGKSKGFGFVEMSSDQEAEKAISALNGTDFEGRNIVVSEARPQPPRAPRPGGSGGFGGHGGGRDRY